MILDLVLARGNDPLTYRIPVGIEFCVGISFCG
jgi:hypothetical protein